MPSSIQPIKIGILYICTGNYHIFWKDFYESCLSFFIPDAEKHFFLFTDHPPLLETPQERVNTFFTPVASWPMPTLKRFEYFSQATDMLGHMDYIFFFNANMLFIKPIDHSFLPTKGLLGVLHPGFYDKKRHLFTYESNPKSLAYIPSTEGQYYFMGGLNGGRSADYIALIHTLRQHIEHDLANGVIACWHDESHLNRYLIDHAEDVDIRGPEYGYPQGWEVAYEPYICIRDKQRYGGHNKLRNLIEASHQGIIVKYIKPLMEFFLRK